MKTEQAVHYNFRINLAKNIDKDMKMNKDHQMSCYTEGVENEKLVVENPNFNNELNISQYVQNLNKGIIKQYFEVYGFQKIEFRGPIISKIYNEFELEYSIY